MCLKRGGDRTSLLLQPAVPAWHGIFLPAKYEK
jgi:hypothetical protein